VISHSLGANYPCPLFAGQRERSAESFRYFNVFWALCCLRTHALAARLYQNRHDTLKLKGQVGKGDTSKKALLNVVIARVISI